MDKHQFDTMTKRLSTRFSRRTALRGGSAGLVAVALGALAGSAAAQGATPGAAGAKVSTPTPGNPIHPAAGIKTEFLFTQTFDAGTWKPKAGSDGTYTLTLAGAAAATTYFSDRPERIVGLSPTDKFLAGLGFTPANPPNAALVAEPVGGGDQDVLVIELMNPAYDAKAGSLTYDAKILANYTGDGIASLAKLQKDYDFAETFGHGGLFIDDCPNASGTCYNVINGQNQTIGNISNIGECYDWHNATCELCDGDGTDQYYGQLCAQAYPDQCQDSDGGWDCYVDNFGVN